MHPTKGGYLSLGVLISDVTEEDIPSEAPTLDDEGSAQARLSYEEQLAIWCLLLQNRLAGKLSPAVTTGPGARAPIVYDLLVPASFAVQELNALSDTPITVKHLPAILKQFRHLEPPYSSVPLQLRKTPKKRGPKAWQDRRLRLAI